MPRLALLLQHTPYIRWHDISYPPGELQHHAILGFNVSSKWNLTCGPGDMVGVKLNALTFNFACGPAEVVLPTNNIYGYLFGEYVTTATGCNFTFNTEIELKNVFKNSDPSLGIDVAPFHHT